MKVSATTTKMNLLNILKSVDFVKVLLGSTFLIAFGFIFGGFVLSKVIRMAMKMVRVNYGKNYPLMLKIVMMIIL